MWALYDQLRMLTIPKLDITRNYEHTSTYKCQERRHINLYYTRPSIAFLYHLRMLLLSYYLSRWQSLLSRWTCESPS